MRYTCLAFCLAIFLPLVAPGLLSSAPPTQIFVLHSYSQEYTWTRRQHEGFMKALAEDSRVNAVVSTENLDTKRRAYDKPYANEFAAHLRLKYAGYKPAAIYVSDDDALLFARDYLSRVFPRTPVFFSGVNDYDVRSSLDPAYFTGVFERQEVAPNIEWLLQMDKDANDLVFIGDGSNTYRAIAAEVRNDLLPYKLRTTFIAEKKLDRALALLRDLPGKYLFLTTVGGMTDENGGVLPLRDILKGLALSGRRVISMEDGYIMDGVLGGYVTSGQKHGMNAAILCFAYLHGKPVVDLPPLLKSPNAYVFDDRVLEQYKIELPDGVRSQAIYLNPRPGFYEKYRALIVWGLIGSGVMLFLVVSGSAIVLTYKNRELRIAQGNAELANRLFNQIAVQSLTVHWEVDSNGLFTYVSPVVYELLGYQPEQLAGKRSYKELLSSEESLTGWTLAAEYFNRRDRFHDLENTAVTRDGRQIWILSNGIPIFDDNGAFLGYHGSSTDITERKQTEAALLREQLLMMTLLDSLPGIFYLYSYPELRLVRWNKNHETLLGYGPGEIRDRLLTEWHIPEAKEAVTAAVEEVMKKGPGMIESPLLTKDGGKIPFLMTGVRLEVSGQLYLMGVGLDVTDRTRAEEERKRLEAQLLQSQKMEAIGQLAGGVAHDFNNIIAAIMSFAYLINLKLKGNEAVKEYVSEITLAAERAAALTQSLLAFGRKQHSNPKPVDLNKTIQNTEKILARTIGEHIHLILRLTEQNATVNADANQLAQVLINLAANARDAMPHGGELIILTERVSLDEDFMKMHDYANSGDYLVMTVTDTGAGMDAATQQRAFEPFFTTKAVGKGSGLGLSMVYGIVKQHEGFIDVKSKIGKGTAIRIYLPASESRAADVESRTQFRPEVSTETILLVEDDANLRQAMMKMLNGFGHSVIEASDGDDAITKYLQHKDNIHLVLMDVIMPRKSGGDAYQELKAIQPNLKIILMSGYAGDFLSGKIEMERDVHFMPKPISPKDLFEKIRAVLNG